MGDVLKIATYMSSHLLSRDGYVHSTHLRYSSSELVATELVTLRAIGVVDGVHRHDILPLELNMTDTI